MEQNKEKEKLMQRDKHMLQKHAVVKQAFVMFLSLAETSNNIHYSLNFVEL